MVTVRLYETAGIRKAEQQIEEEGIKKTHLLIQDADLVLIILDRSLPYPSGVDLEIALDIKNKKSILVLNKSDLPKIIDMSESNFRHLRTTVVSTNEKESISSLTGLIQNLLLEEYKTENEFNLSVNLRQSSALLKAQNAIQKSLETLEVGNANEFSVPDLKEAISCLNCIVDTKDNEDMLNLLFSSFCIGK